MFELREGSCFPRLLVGVNVGLAIVDGIIAVFAFSQLLRMHSRNSHVGWTRQKVFAALAVLLILTEISIYFATVFHLMIGSSNMGYLIYFVTTLVATCNGWICWSHSCGFILIAFPKILFFAAFLLLLSFWVDLCHQADDEDEDDEECSIQEALLEKSLNKPTEFNVEIHRRCFPFRCIHVGSRQKIVIMVTVLVFVLMIGFSVLIWIGMGKNPIDSSMVARVYVDLFAIAMILLGGALACYGLLLCLKMRRVRSERASAEMWKFAGLAAVSVLCFTSSALVALFTDIPVLYHWLPQRLNGVYTSLLLILYYFMGSSIPSAFVLWVMRELPPVAVSNMHVESRTVTFISDDSEPVHPQRWTAATSSQNQTSRASPI